jgi:YVTN family beta-propeller protein
VYVANYVSSSLSVIDSSSNMVIQTITGITSANGVAYDPDHNLVWVTNYDSDQVTPIDADSLAPLAPVAVGDGPWGVAYDQVHEYVYVVNSEEDSVTVLDAATRAVTDTLSGAFSQPFHAAANPVTGKVYVTNFGDHSVAVLEGASVRNVVNLNVGNPGTQPYGVTVDETRDLVYVATVDSHRVVVIGADAEGNPDQLVGWAALHRGFGDPTRPVPLRVIAVNPDIGPTGDGGHVWTTTAMADGSEANQVLLIPKGWEGYFDYPVPYDLGTNPSEGIVVDRVSDWVYVSGGSSAGTVTVLGDNTDSCLVPFGVDDGLGLEMSVVR